MLKFLLLIVLALCCFATNAQDVFNYNDILVSYDSTAAPGTAANPVLPDSTTMAKWVVTPRLSWNAANFKSYIWNGMQFRLRYPNNYDPAASIKYPIIVFYHGGGEIGSVYDNEIHLQLGAQVFEQRINNNEWNGFLLFPQEPAIGWGDYQFSRINHVLDTLQKYNNIDPDRVISAGLSAGGYGALAYAGKYPKRVAAAMAASPLQAVSLTSNVTDWVHIPVWFANGGLDVNPDPVSTASFYTGVRNAGGDIYQTYFANNGHNTWTDMWNARDASGTYITDSYWNNAHKAQPVVYFKNDQFCEGQAIAARMGITAGFYAYEWEKDGSPLPGANGNEYIATQAGQYRVHFRRTAGAGWSAWTPKPVLIGTKKCAVDTLYSEHFTSDNLYNSTTAYSKGNFTCQNGIITSGTNLFSQDAAGIQGGRFMANFTNAATGYTYAAGDLVWSNPNPIPVSANTAYEYSFYAGGQNANAPAKLVPVINGKALIPDSVALQGVGNSSWRKYSYSWNSGNATAATLEIHNKAFNTTGNDFTIDEIAFRKITTLPLPACVINTAPVNGATLATQTTATLSWPSVATAISYDVYIWSGIAMPALPTANVAASSYNASGLVAGTAYKWFVAPRNAIGAALGCASTNTTGFTTAALPVPACVVNTSPANGSTIASASSATLSWSATATAISYDVYIWTGSAIPVSPAATVTGTTYNATGLSEATNYKWYIAPRNAYGVATGCAANNSTNFTTATISIIPPFCTFNSSPINGSTVSNPNTATLKWREAANASSYDLYIWSGPNAPASPTINVTGTSYVANGLSASTLYNWYVAPRNAFGAAKGCGSVNKSRFSTADAPRNDDEGKGLTGDYYNNPNLAGKITMSRIDTTINFDWGFFSPSIFIDPRTFSVRWSGQVKPAYSETYTFYSICDNGARLWVDGKLLIDSWKDKLVVENSGSIRLTAGVKYNIVLEYYEKKGTAVAKLLWSSFSTRKAIIPKTRLFPLIDDNDGSGKDKLIRKLEDGINKNRFLDLSPLSGCVVFPNPVLSGQNAILQIINAKGGPVTIELMGASGTIFLSEKTTVGPGFTTKTLQTAALRPGLYIIRITGVEGKPADLKLIIY